MFFKLDVDELTASVESSQGVLVAGEADVLERERELKRQNDLFERNMGSAKERDDAETAYQRAVGMRTEKAGLLAQAQQRLKYARHRLDETEIRAPYDGAITSRMVDTGEPANSAPVTHLLEIQEIGTLYLEFALPQELLGTVTVGTPLEFTVEGVPEGRGTATVAVIFPAIDETTRSFRSRAIITNSDGKFSPGLLAEVRVVAKEVAAALVLPRTAVSRTAGGWQVLVSEGGRPVAKTIEVGLVGDDLIQISSGLNEGDAVIAGAGS